MTRSEAAVLVALATSVLASGCRRSRLVPRGDGAAVVIAAPAAPEEGPVIDEREPNDGPAHATPLVLGGDPLTAAGRGTLPGSGKGADVDLFALEIPGEPPAAGADAGLAGARRLVVELHPEPGLAPALQLLDAAGRTLAGSTAGPGERDGLPNVGVLPGARYLLRLRPAPPEARGRGAGGDAGAGLGYRLVARLLDFEIGDEREPNDRAAAATVLAPAREAPEAAGFFGWRRDEDWYRLPLDDLPPGTVLDVELDGVEEVTASVAVANAAEQRIAAARGRRGERVTLRNVSVAALARPADAGGPGAPFAYVVVRAEGGRSLERRYGLRVRPEVQREGTETEPNDDVRRASPVDEGTTLGFLPPGDVDVHRFVPAAAVEVEVELVPPPRLDVKLELLHPDGRLLARGDAAGRGKPERLTVGITGPVLLRVTAGRGEGDADEPYQLRIAARPLPPDAGEAPP